MREQPRDEHDLIQPVEHRHLRSVGVVESVCSVSAGVCFLFQQSNGESRLPRRIVSSLKTLSAIDDQRRPRSIQLGPPS